MKEKKNEGITLIALVITIIVLLILAGVTLSTLFGNNGILTESQLAVQANKEANAKEQVQLAWMGCETEYQSAWTQDSSVVKKDYFDPDDLNRNLGTGEVKSVNYVESGKSTVTYTLDGIEYEFEIANGQVYKVGQAPDVTEPEEKPNGPGSAEGSSAEWEFDASTGTILSIKLNDSGVYAFNTSTIIIPSTIDGVKVKKIGRLYKDDLEGSFGIGSGGEYLKKVIISDGIEEIGDAAFTNCEMESIEIPESVTKIGGWAFANCSALQNVKLPSGIKTLEGSTFIGCYNLKEIELNEGLETIKTHALVQTGIQKLYIPSTVKKIEDDIMCDYGNNLKTIEVDNNNLKYSDKEKNNIIVENDTEKVILGCINSTLPEGINSIARSAFARIEGLNQIQFPSSLRIIYDDAFSYSGLTSITLPDGFTTIEDCAFELATSLTSIYIPNTVQSIGDYAFCDCSSLTNITIPNSVTSIGSYAFNYCNKLQAINIATGSPLSESSSNFPWGFDRNKIHFNQ